MNQVLEFEASDCCPGCWLQPLQPSLPFPNTEVFPFLWVPPSQGRFMASTHSVPCMSVAAGAAGAGHRQQGWVQVGQTRGK